jgi:hypothetical protein
MKTRPFNFIDEPIEVEFDIQPVREKSPSCPQRFTWRGVSFTIKAVHEEWVDFARRGRMSANMAPVHLASAARNGSWGVGRFYFRVVVESGQIFEIYYDRAPKDVDNRKGGWFLKGERHINRDEER